MAFFLELNCHKANVHACIKATVKWLLSFESCLELTYIQRVPRMFRFIRVTQMFVLRSGSPVVTLHVLFYCILKWHFYLFINFFLRQLPSRYIAYIECVTQVSAQVQEGSLIVKSGGDVGLIKIDEERPMSWLG